jgi:hypothetical protein
MTVDNALENATLLDVGRGNVAFHMDVHGRRSSDYRIPGYPYPFPPDPPPPVFGRQPTRQCARPAARSAAPISSTAASSASR